MYIFSGADLSALVREAAVTALRQRMLLPNAADDVNIRVGKRHFEVAFSKVKPSVSEKVK